MAVTRGDSADSVGVRLSGIALLAVGVAKARLNRRRPLAEPRHANTRGSARRRHLTDICGAGGGQDAKGQASIQRRSRNSGARRCHRNEDLVAIHSAHPLPQGVVGPPKNIGSSLRTLVGEGNFFFRMTSVPGGRTPVPGQLYRGRGPRDRPEGRLRPCCGPGLPARRIPPARLPQ